MERHFHRVGSVGLAAALLLSVAVGLGQTRRRSSGASRAKSERQRMDEQVYSQLTKAWTSFYNGKYERGVKQATPLLKLTDRRYRWVAIEAAHIQARSYWGHGGRSGHDFTASEE